MTTAFSNDVNGDMVFAQQLYGYAKKGDVFLGITTSGNSKNVLYAATAAKALGVTVIGLTGRDGGWIKEFQMYLSSFRYRKPLRSRNCIFLYTMPCA